MQIPGLVFIDHRRLAATAFKDIGRSASVETAIHWAVL